MGLTEFLIHFFTTLIEKTGYPGIFALMTLESMVAPVPSEAVMPFAGFLWFDGKMALIWIVVSSTLGSIAGSLISYLIGKYASQPFVRRFGKYLLLNEEHLHQTERFFAQYGEKTIFFARFIPVVRHLISIPAGVGKMRLSKFLTYTALGAGLWNAFLAYLGYLLGRNWERIRAFGEALDILIVIVIVAAVVYFFYRQKKKKKPLPSGS